MCFSHLVMFANPSKAVLCLSSCFCYSCFMFSILCCSSKPWDDILGESFPLCSLVACVSRFCHFSMRCSRSGMLLNVSILSLSQYMYCFFNCYLFPKIVDYWQHQAIELKSHMSLQLFIPSLNKALKQHPAIHNGISTKQWINNNRITKNT